jgi:hypothetical protein
MDVLKTASRQRLRQLFATSVRPRQLDFTKTNKAMRRQWVSRLGRAVDDFVQDLRFAIRGLVKTPAFTVIAVLSLAVGISVNTAFFTVIAARWLQPIPGVNGTDRMVEVLSTTKGREFQEWSEANYRDVREWMKAVDGPIEELAGYEEVCRRSAIFWEWSRANRSVSHSIENDVDAQA